VTIRDIAPGKRGHSSGRHNGWQRQQSSLTSGSLRQGRGGAVTRRQASKRTARHRRYTLCGTPDRPLDHVVCPAEGALPCRILPKPPLSSPRMMPWREQVRASAFAARSWPGPGEISRPPVETRIDLDPWAAAGCRIAPCAPRSATSRSAEGAYAMHHRGRGGAIRALDAGIQSILFPGPGPLWASTAKRAQHGSAGVIDVSPKIALFHI
jgi:hypothetical protein